MSGTVQLIEELRRELTVYDDADALGLPPSQTRFTRRRARTIWNDCWTHLRDERPDVFHRDFRSSLIDTQALAYLFVRKQYSEFVPSLRLNRGERVALGRLREQFRRWTGLVALEQPARLRLVRDGCPLLSAERQAFSPDCSAQTFGWSPGPLRRTVLFYEDKLGELRRENLEWMLVAIVLHEEVHSAVHFAAGCPRPYDEDDTLTPLVEELAVKLVSNVAELVDEGVPTRRRLREWNEVSYQGELLNRLLEAVPGARGDDIAAAASDLAVATVAAGSSEAVLAELASRSRRSRRWWRAALA